MVQLKKMNWYYALLFVVGAFTLSSCSSDDDETEDFGTLETPAFKEVSAFYSITESGSDYSSIELTESGNYVIVKNSNAHRAMSASNETMSTLVASPWYQATTRNSAYDNIITGTYTKSGNDTFVLEGFGTITIKNGGGTTFSLEITENGAEPYTLTAAKKEQYEGTPETNKLCRTWRIAGMRMTMSGAAQNEGQAYNFSFDESVNDGNMGELMYKIYVSTIRWAISVSGESVPEKYIQEELAQEKQQIINAYPVVDKMIFTQAGTYMVTYADSRLAVSTWSWIGTTFDKIHYSWDYSNASSVMAGDCSVEFQGGRCIITETKSNLSSDVVSGANAKLVYTLVESK